jgi:DNA transformation protein and related proteins
MRNLGPACERDLNAVGVYTAADLVALGEEAAFLKMLEGRRRIGKGAKYCHAAYLYALYGAIHDIDWRDVPDKKKTEFKTLTAELRDSGDFR